jgi:hypothetical protein
MALQNTTTISALNWGSRNASANSIGRRVRGTIGDWVRKALDPYRPELHYMRGPGPNAAKRTDSLDAEQNVDARHLGSG